MKNATLIVLALIFGLCAVTFTGCQGKTKTQDNQEKTSLVEKAKGFSPSGPARDQSASPVLFSLTEPRSSATWFTTGLASLLTESPNDTKDRFDDDCKQSLHMQLARRSKDA